MSRARYRRPPSVRGQRTALLAAIAGLGLAVAVTDPEQATSPEPTTAAAASFVGGPSGCVMPDPTTRGCLTATAAHGLAEIERVFGAVRGGPAIRSAGCWDPHLQNPTSDHPRGSACDLFPGEAGVFAAGAELEHGWQLARWLRANREPLRVRYLIWQGRIWQADLDRDDGGWGRPYNGGGVYDPTDATGGHFDHVHVSFEP